MAMTTPDAILVRLAALGPTGVRRPLDAIRRRVMDEVMELAEAAADYAAGLGPSEDALAEAADVWYYTALAAANGAPSSSVALWRRTALQMLKEAGLGHVVPFAAQAALAKYATRFIVNQRRKDHAAERAAIGRVLQSGGLPEDIRTALARAGIINARA